MNARDEHVTVDGIEKLRRGELPREETGATIAHLEQCAECRKRALRMPSIRRSAETVLEEHPALEDLIAYAEGTLDVPLRQDIARHVRHCTRCGEDVGDVSQERRRLQPRSSWHLAAAAALGIAILGVVWLATRRASDAPPPEAVPVVRVTPEASSRSEWDVLIDDARRQRGMPMPEVVRRLRGVRDPLRGGESASAGVPMQPAGVVVASQQPRFSWRRSGDERYVVTIECSGAIAAQSGPIAARAWTPSRPLPRGARCVWALERESDHAILPAPPAPQPAFAVLDEESSSEIERAKRERRGDDFLIALLYARAGARSEAEEYLRKHLANHPGDAAASGILRDLESW